MRILALATLFAEAVCLLGQTPQIALQANLQGYGWKADRGVLHGASLPYTIDFADDDSLWMVFPSEFSKVLQSRDTPAEYSGEVLHIAPSGEVLGECNTSSSAWNRVKIFSHRSDGFTLHMAHKLIAFDAHCREQSSYPITSKIDVLPSPNRALIYVLEKANHVTVLNDDGLKKVKEFDLPAKASGTQVLFGDRWAIFPVDIPTKGCWQSQFSRMAIDTGLIIPWVTIECASFNLLGNDHIVYSNRGGDGALRITGGAGDIGAEYKPPHDAHIDPSVLGSVPVASPASLRIVEELIKTKGRHPSLDMSGKFVGRDIVLLDMHTGTALLTVKVPMDSLAYAYALSRDGKKFAVLLNSQLTVYKVP